MTAWHDARSAAAPGHRRHRGDRPWPPLVPDRVVARLRRAPPGGDASRMRAARIAPWVAVAAAGAACAGAGVLLALGGSEEANDWVAVPWLAATLASMVVGLVLARRCARNPIGWLLLANGLTLAATALAEEWARYSVIGEPGGLPAAGWAVLVTERAWPLLFAFMAAIAWIFPDGRLPSRRWRPFAYAAGLSFAVLVVLSFLAAERFAGPYANVDSPLPELS